VLGGRLGDQVGAEIENPYDRIREKGYQGSYTPHSARVAAVYDLPLGRGKHYLSQGAGWLNHIVGGWSIAPLLTFSGHLRYEPTFTGRDPANIGRTSIGPTPFRADVIPGCDPYAGGTFPGFYWNRNCFAFPANGRFGNVGRGFLHGPWVWNLDFNAFKTWYLTAKENGPISRQNFIPLISSTTPTRAGRRRRTLQALTLDGLTLAVAE
jgi:hypothetical protein